MFRLLLCGALLAGAANAADVVISQIYGGGGNTGATLRNDFIELFNRGTQPVDITGWSVQYSSATGTSWQATSLAGVLQPGRYYLVQQAAGAGGTQSLPRPDATGEIALSATAGKVALARTSDPLTGGTPATATIVDVVGYGAAGFFEKAPAPGLSNSTAALRVNSGCADTDDNSADFRSGTAAPRNSETPAVNCAEAVQPAPLVTISEVQGTGDKSPLSGQTVAVRGIVTARKSNGFFLQSATPDGDPATSDGLFVFTSSTPPASAGSGNLIEVSGTVAEFGGALVTNTLTELIDPYAYQVISSGNSLPGPVDVHAGTTLESLESMRVAVAELRVVGPTSGSVNEAAATSTSNGLFYGVIPARERPFRTAMLESEERPSLLRIDTRGEGVTLVNVASGATVRNITGPLDVSGTRYSVLAESAPVVVPSPLAAAPVSAAGTNEFTVAAMNLRRLFDTANDPGTSDPVLTSDAFTRRIDRLARQIRDLLRSPDIIGVEEVENLATLEALARAAGPDYRAFLEEGNDIGGIDVGFLIRTSRVQVTPNAVLQLFKADLLDGQPLYDRPPLAIRVQVGGLPVTVIVNHARSLLDIEDERVRTKRFWQGLTLARYVELRQRQLPGEGLILLGDFNAFMNSQELGFFTGRNALFFMAIGGPVFLRPPLTNLTELLPPDQHYTYVEDGIAQALDHVFVNEALMPRLTRYVIARVNADFPEIVSNDAARLERASDHDIPVAYFRFEPALLRPLAVTNAASYLSGAVAPGELVTIFGAGFTSATRVLFDGAPAQVIQALPAQLSVVVPQLTGGTTLLAIGSESFTLPVQSTAPGVFAVLNQNYTVNSPGTPASAGSALQIFATGLGAGPVSVTLSNIPVTLEYFGPAPGYPGVQQVNARIPEGVNGEAVQLQVSAAGRVSQPGLAISVAGR